MVASKVSAVSSVPDRKDRRSRMKQVIIMQGLSGSGKSHWVDMNYPDHPNVVSADRFFLYTDEAPLEYNFRPELLGKAHAFCMNNFIRMLEIPFPATGDGSGITPTIIVDNTNTERWEWKNYVKLAEHFGYEWAVVDMYDGALTNEELSDRNEHGVPLEVIERQRERYEHANSEELLSYSQHKGVDPTAVYRRNNDKPKGKQ